MNDEPSLEQDLDAGLDALEAIGTRYLELRAVLQTVAEDLDAPTFEQVRMRLDSRGFKVAAWASDLAKVPPTPALIGDECERLRRIADRCHQLGCTLVRTMGFRPHFADRREQFDRSCDGLAVLTELAATMGVRLALENAPNPRSITSAPEDVERMLDSLLPAPVGLVFDPGNFAIAGHDVRAALEKLLHRITHVHVKDCRCVGDWGSFCQPGEGIAEIPLMLDALARGGYRGALTLEPHLLHQNGRHYSGFAGYVAAGEALVRLCRQAGLSLKGKLI
jgi:sugar phosphate isomerase/epimerase